MDGVMADRDTVVRYRRVLVRLYMPGKYVIPASWLPFQIVVGVRFV